jgi:tetratricopeptide (TPR) repeat protein
VCRLDRSSRSITTRQRELNGVAIAFSSIAILTPLFSFLQLSSMCPLLVAFESYNNRDGELNGSCDVLVQATKDAEASGNSLNICLIFYTRIYCHFSVGEFEKALQLLDEKNAKYPQMDGSIFEAFPLFLEGLCIFACARKQDNPASRKRLIQRGRKVMKMLQKMSVQNPDSCLGKATLLEAEYAAIRKNESLAKIKYSEAMALSIGHNNYYETIFSKQAAGMHYVFDLNDPKTGLQYLQESIDTSKEFGGHAAARHWEGYVREIKDRRRYSNFRSGF